MLALYDLLANTKLSAERLCVVGRCDTAVEMNSSADVSNLSASQSSDLTGEGDLESTYAV